MVIAINYALAQFVGNSIQSWHCLFCDHVTANDLDLLKHSICHTILESKTEIKTSGKGVCNGEELSFSKTLQFTTASNPISEQSTEDKFENVSDIGSPKAHEDENADDDFANLSSELQINDKLLSSLPFVEASIITAEEHQHIETCKDDMNITNPEDALDGVVYTKRGENDNEAQIAELKQRQCPACHKIFNCYIAWKQHLDNDHVDCKDIEMCKKIDAAISDPHVCRLCNISFSTNAIFLKHIKSEHSTPQKENICANCSTRFTSQLQLAFHAKSCIDDSIVKDKDDKKWMCMFCKKRCINRRALNNHLRRHDGEGLLFQCDKCDKSFTESKLYISHYGYHYTKKTGPSVCDICGEKFEKQWQVASHVKRYHLKETFECEKCHKKFTTKGYLKSHAKSHEGKFSFTCNVCSKGFQDKYAYEVHLGCHPETKELARQFKCSHCAKVLCSATSLKLHIDNKHKFVTYSCHLCNKYYKSKDYLKRHILGAHLKQFKYHCTDCVKGFNVKREYEYHQKTHTDNLSKDTFRCKQCNKPLKSEQSLRNHVRFMHENFTYKCKECGKPFKSFDSLKLHLHHHSINQVCSMCHKGFTKVSDFEKHLQKHLDQTYPLEDFQQEVEVGDGVGSLTETDIEEKNFRIIEMMLESDKEKLKL